jgi:alkyl sulfatase BDS1-like metallo-beta-lactamase superfamily hydrolase
VPRGEKGQVDAGLGKALSFGTTTLVATDPATITTRATPRRPRRDVV